MRDGRLGCERDRRLGCERDGGSRGSHGGLAVHRVGSGLNVCDAKLGFKVQTRTIECDRTIGIARPTSFRR